MSNSGTNHISQRVYIYVYIDIDTYIYIIIIIIIYIGSFNELKKQKTEVPQKRRTAGWCRVQVILKARVLVSEIYVSFIQPLKVLSSTLISFSFRRFDLISTLRFPAVCSVASTQSFPKFWLLSQALMSFRQAAALSSSTASRKGNTNFKHLEVSMATRLGETSRRPLDS